LKAVLVVYPQAQLEVTDTGLVLLPSRPHIPPLNKQRIFFGFAEELPAPMAAVHSASGRIDIPVPVRCSALKTPAGCGQIL
jgi:hypothetical protein